MENKTAEGVFQISFFLSILLLSFSMLCMTSPKYLGIGITLLFISIGFMTMNIMISVKKRALRNLNKEKTKSRVVPYL